MRFRSQFLVAALVGVSVLLTPARAATVLPFDYRDGLIWIKAGVEGAEKPLNLLLDSGANVSVINLPTAKSMGIAIGKPVQVDGVNASATGYWPQHITSRRDGLPLPDEFLAVDLSELSKGSEVTVDGLLGADFFQKHVVRIDFANRKVSIDSSAPVSGAREILPLRPNQNALEVPVAVNGGVQQWVRLDTGCNSPLHWVNANVRVDKASTQVAVALTESAIPMTTTKVKLGKLNFAGVPTGIHTTEIFAGEAGLLGNGLLDRFPSVTIDARAGRLILEGKPQAR